MTSRLRLSSTFLTGLLIAMAGPAPAEGPGEKGPDGSKPVQAQAKPKARPVNFARDVRPILSDNCFACHGPDDKTRKAGLRLDTKEGMLAKLKSGEVSVVPGKPDESDLVFRLETDDPEAKMPPKKSGKHLTAAQVDILRRWVEQGATWTTHWAFEPPRKAELPAVKDAAWPKGPIDRFILARLEAEGLAPAPEAGLTTLVRRVFLDLTGLPPTPRDVDLFLADNSGDAYEKLVDRLLDSPRYGEHMARFWLDAARYGDTHGLHLDNYREIWPYRDWVIRAFNTNKPFDRFIVEQLAGDLLPNPTLDQFVATGFNRCHVSTSEGGSIEEEVYVRNVVDQIDTNGTVFLGMTMGCARCHDHKYDPILQKDYYSLQAFFADIRADDQIPVATPEQIREYKEKRAVWEEKTATIRAEMAKLEEPKRNAIIKDYFKKYPADIQESLNKAPADRTPMDWLYHYKAAQYIEPGSYQYIASPTACAAALKGEAKKRYQELTEQLHEFDGIKPKDLPLGTGIIDAGETAPKHFLLRRGVFDAPGVEVEPAFPSALDKQAPHIDSLADQHSTGRRSALANWLASPENPMTAKVMTNRVWHYHFGRGIVATPSDFGAQGQPASNLELLDWLTTRFVKDGWSLKKLHRLIMTSSTYRQSTTVSVEVVKKDPDDRLFSRFPLKRLEAEVIRDSSLAVAGLLNPKMGGPSIFPVIPKGMEVRGGWPVTASETERNRRSVYVFVRRNTRYPMFEAFDMPDPYESCPRRYVSTTSSQALMLLNGDLSVQWAQNFAGRVLSGSGADPVAVVDTAYQIAFGRHPEAIEVQQAREFLSSQSALIEQRVGQGQEISLPVYAEGKTAIEQPKARAAAVVDFCHVLMNSNEFVYSN
jgi:mono/diheme cytochrome c family protein